MIRKLADMTWTEVRDLDLRTAVAILPTGAVEAHGPHLPLSTDGIISAGMAEEGARLLAAKGLSPVLLPPVDYTVAEFGASFPGTVTLRPATATALLVDIAMSLHGHGWRYLAIANSHFDPGHLASLYAACGEIRESTELRVIFPDVTRKPWALRLTDEFKSGACHAGRYEGSIVLARRGDLVREGARRELVPNLRSLSTAIRDGLDSFEAAGGDMAYFGDPAAATVMEGEATLAILGEILAEAVWDVMSSEDASADDSPQSSTTAPS